MTTRDALARRMSDRFARLYGPVAVLTVAFTFLPVLADVTEKSAGGGTISWKFGTLWEMAGRGDTPNPALIGLLLVAVFVVLLVVATVRDVVSMGLPVTIAVLAALLVLMLVTRPGTGSVRPELTDIGIADVAVLTFCFGVAVVHAVRLGRLPYPHEVPAEQQRESDNA